MLALEPRYLFDAAVVTTVADTTSSPTTDTSASSTGAADSSQQNTVTLSATVEAATGADIPNQLIFVAENNIDTEGLNFVGQIFPHPDGVTFSLIEVEGTGSDTFAVSDSGAITVKDNTRLDYENDLLPPLETVEFQDHETPFLRFQVRVEGEGFDPYSITINVLLQDFNDAPEAATPSDTTIGLGETAMVQVSATDQDIDGDSNNDRPAWSVITYDLESPPTGASIDADGLFTWAPTEAGTTTITVKVSNDGELEQTVQFDVTVATPPSGINDSTDTGSQTESTSSEESGEESGEEGSEEEGEENGEEGSEDGGPDAYTEGPADPAEEDTQKEAEKFEAELDTLLAEKDFTETAKASGAGKPEAQQPQTRAAEIAEIMSIMDKAAALVTQCNVSQPPFL
jgi:hypothetical protein